MSSEDSYEVHDIQWTRAKTARFWDHTSSRPDYFSRLVGDTVVKMVVRAGVSLQGRVLDFGCGPGYLLDSLLRLGVPCEGADFSKSAITALTKRLGGERLFRGAHQITALPSDLPEETFDVIFFIETIEHLLDQDLEPTITELRRLLKPNGTLVITTPNDEDLTHLQVICPDCGSKFHAMQHVRHWSDESLTKYLGERGIRRTTAKLVTLRPTRLGTLAFSVATRLLKKKPPNLIWLGVRT